MQQHASYFTYKAYEADIPGGIVRFFYELATDGILRKFTETVTFTPPKNISGDPDSSLKAILDSLHILLGISYWKAACPADIRVDSQTLSEEQAVFWNMVYTKGLGEFFYKNSIDFRGLVQFPFTKNGKTEPQSKNMTDRSLVLLGSGKDSIVTAELLKKNEKAFSLYTLNARTIHRETAGMIGKDLIEIKRIIDPQLFELNKNPGMFNGHIPITAITSFTGLLASYLYDYRYVILSNEESANYGNVEYLGAQVNHQWSKSYEFEELFRRYVRSFITGSIEYFSLLRPLTELNIVKLFIQYERYFNVFTSCNRNFGILKERPATRWCGECPKCAFVFLLLAAFLPKSDVIAIFHRNLLNDDTLLPTYKELLGIEGVKPFECVGTPEEVLVAFASILEHGEYSEDSVMRNLSFIISDKLKDKKVILDDVLTLSRKHFIPTEFTHILE